jgi:hypothetical protein
MYVHWREREHEEVSELVGEDPNAMAALMQCGFLKFFLCPFMWAQPRLLNALIDYWHLDAEAFMLEGQSPVPMNEDIYFFYRPLYERGTSQLPNFSFGSA